MVDRNDELVALEVEETGKINAAALQKWQVCTYGGDMGRII